MKEKKPVTIFSMGFDGIWHNYPKQNIAKSIWIPIALSICCLILIDIFSVDQLSYIVEISNIIISIIPNILGFMLTGYALIIGITDSETILEISKKDNDDTNPSLFQQVSATFAIVLITMSITVIFGLIFKFIANLNICISWMPNWIAFVLNSFYTLLLLFALFYSVISLIDIIKNIHSLGQLIHVINRNKNISRIKNGRGNENPDAN